MEDLISTVQDGPLAARLDAWFDPGVESDTAELRHFPGTRAWR